MDYSYRPKITGRGGAQIVSIPVALGTITANDTTTYSVPTPRGRFYVLGASYQCAVKPIDADGTFVATLAKYRAATNDATTISAELDLEADTVANESVALTVNGGDVNRTIRVGDTLQFVVVNNSAGIGTQHAGAFLVVELARLD
jgi:hypothetical protein